MVAGDIVRDGMVNAADRVKVRVDANGNTYASDVTGDGIVNSTDRQIVDRNSNRISSIGDIFPTLYGKKAIFNNDEKYEISSDLDPVLAVRLNENAKAFDENGKIEEAPEYKGATTQTDGLAYRVIGETEIVDGTVRVNVYFKNEGD